MAGVRKKPLKSGKYQGWYKNSVGERKFFAGTRNRAETRRMAERFEDDHRQILLGYRPAPRSSQKHTNRAFRDVAGEYSAWGKAQGGRGGYGWSDTHARMRRTHLAWWGKKLAIEKMGDLEGILPRAETALRMLMDNDKRGKTVQNYAEALKGFCNWCVQRGYLAANPVVLLGGFDTTPGVDRRAMTEEEVQKLFAGCAPRRRLVYEVALCSGLRAGELRALRVKDLDRKAGGLRLRSEWTKNRKNGFQLLPVFLVTRLAESARGKTAGDALLYVPSHTARDLDKDMRAAGITKTTPDGKLDFHAFRVAYGTFAFESGAHEKEVQVMLRHSTPNLTVNRYARARPTRLAEVAENIGAKVGVTTERVQSVHHPAERGDGSSSNALSHQGIRHVRSQNGRGFDSRRLHHSSSLLVLPCKALVDTPPEPVGFGCIL